MKTETQPPVGTVAVLGVGTMGTQISFTCAKRGFAVRLMDRSSHAIEAAHAKHRDWPGHACSLVSIRG